MKTKENKTKPKKVNSQVFIFKKGAKLKGTIFAIERNRVWVDIDGKYMGFVPKQEISDSSLIEIGNKIEVSILELADSEGNIVFSMRPLNKEEVWKMLKEGYENNAILEVEAIQANRGGLIVCKEGVCGFLPVSQLTLRHYPRVEGGDKGEILKILTGYIGKKFLVRIINFDYDPAKLIFSERAAEEEKNKERIKKLRVGDILEVEVTGIADFGLFVKFLDDLEGLIHISEISWERIDDLKSHFETGQKLKAKIVSIENGRVAFSLKRLIPDPWLTKAKKFKPGQKIKGVIKRIVPFGVLARIEEGIEGLVPFSLIYLKEKGEIAKIYKEGDEREFKIKEIDPENHRLILIDPQFSEQKLSSEEEKLKKLGLSEEIASKIVREGKSLKDLKKMSFKEMVSTFGISLKSAKSIEKVINKGKIDLKNKIQKKFKPKPKFKKSKASNKKLFESKK